MVSKKQRKSEWNSPTPEEREECEKYLRTMEKRKGVKESYPAEARCKVSTTKKKKKSKKSKIRNKHKRRVNEEVNALSWEENTDHCWEDKKRQKRKKVKSVFNDRPPVQNNKRSKSDNILKRKIRKAPCKKKVVFDSDICSVSYCKKITLSSSPVLSQACFTFENKVAVDEPGDRGHKASDETDENCNSQDLFITQKTFLVPADCSSSESVDVPIPGPGCEHTKMLAQPFPALVHARSTAERATQTDGFSTELSSFLKFQKQCQKTLCSKQPVDLSLPKRSRMEPDLFCTSSRASSKGEEGPLNHKVTSADWNEENDGVARSKADISQLKVIQTKLNESFFFRVKGEGDSPKTQSPLMKLCETSERITKK